MKDENPKVIYLKDYREPDYWITKTELEFELQDSATTVTATLRVERNPKAQEAAPLVLHGQELELLSVELNDSKLSSQEYYVDPETLTIEGLQNRNTLRCVTRIKPQENTSLEGLYRSRKIYCTQCEAEGFRKITYYLDRPDVMSEFVTKISADKSQFPMLLSNGNLTESGDLENNRHYAIWSDPFKKPCYLFALVAGDLTCVRDSYTTMSGRNIDLRVYVEAKDHNKCDHAISSLKNAMKWDELVYGREYDLDIFMIVAVDDFNMGAMENKGLNIFNTSCVLANSETTTDAAFQRVEGVVAHEYFHNWSGNRVTCRDWFQLSLKEGFTVFRDQEFSADMGSRTAKRVEDVTLLRTIQFAEDAGPMAHPVQPRSFIEISNFYTVTIYEKGSEIVRMIHTLLGPELFRKGSDLYFSRHDGKAITIEDFVTAMAEVSGRNLDQFMRWYRQAGTPIVKAHGEYNAKCKTFTLKLSQFCPATAESEEKLPFHIPLAIGLIGEAGCLPLKLNNCNPNDSPIDNTHTVLELTEAEQSFVFSEVNEAPVPSLLRGFSAPVKLQYNYCRDDLMCLMSRDDDGFCRWNASQQLVTEVIQEVMAALFKEPAPRVDERLLEAYRAVLIDTSLDPAMVALMLELPSEAYLAELSAVTDVDTIHYGRQHVERKIAHVLYNDFLKIYQTLNIERPYQFSASEIARRSLKNICLRYLVASGEDEALNLCLRQLTSAHNMTDELAAFTAIVHSSKKSVLELKQQTIDRFYEKWQREALVINSWFSVQASCPERDALNRVKFLMEHPAFDIHNPNKIRALVGTFSMHNPVNFHNKNGAGYQFLTDQIVYLNTSNPQMAARLLTPLTKWKRFDEIRRQMMKMELEKIRAQPKLSKDVYEVVMKSLNN